MPSGYAKTADLKKGLLQRLERLQQQTQVEPCDMGELKVGFGEKHRGSTYEKAFNDQKWVRCLLQHPSASEEQMQFMRYVEWRIQKLEDESPYEPMPGRRGGNRTPPTPGRSSSSTGNDKGIKGQNTGLQPKAKPKNAPTKAKEIHLPAMESDLLTEYEQVDEDFHETVEPERVKEEARSLIETWTQPEKEQMLKVLREECARV